MSTGCYIRPAFINKQVSALQERAGPVTPIAYASVGFDGDGLLEAIDSLLR